jgi:hypothetical protein
MRQVQPLQHRFRMLENGMVPASGLVDVVATDHDLLDLVELMDSIEAGR